MKEWIRGACETLLKKETRRAGRRIEKQGMI